MANPVERAACTACSFIASGATPHAAAVGLNAHVAHAHTREMAGG